MNTNNLYAAVQYFAEEPLRLSMSGWIHNTYSTYKAPPCGTVACLAGSAMVLAARAEGKKDWTDITEFASDIAMRFFDIDERQADLLFYTNRWPDLHYRMYHTLQTEFEQCRNPHVWPVIKRMMVKVLQLRIDEFIESEQILADNPQPPHDEDHDDEE